MQYAVSSYTPNLSTLITTRHARKASIGNHKLLVVCQPNSIAGKKPLKSGLDEVKRVYKCVPPEFLIRINGETIRGDIEQAIRDDIKHTNIDNVLRRLEDVSLVHFVLEENIGYRVRQQEIRQPDQVIGSEPSNRSEEGNRS